MIDLRHLDAYYGESRVLNDVSLNVCDGEIVALVGRNGVGKTTTLKSIMGLVKTPTGSIKLGDTELIELEPYERARLGIGYVPQGRDIFPQMTVEENLMLGLEARTEASTDLDAVLNDIYELFPIVKKFLPRKGGDLSGGQQQQLAIARALISEPRLLILDEPTEGIQPSIIQEIGAAIKKINRTRGISILIVEQYLDFVLSISEKYYVMDKGQIVMDGLVSEADPAAIQAKMMVS
ncbi:MAG: urea ABC transporter ATP-binding subunit UrtE [Selenomonadaceae bacterium]